MVYIYGSGQPYLCVYKCVCVRVCALVVYVNVCVCVRVCDLALRQVERITRLQLFHC